MRHRARRQRALVYVRAGVDLQKKFRGSQTAAGCAGGGRQEVEEYFVKESKKLDDDMVATFKKNNVEVVTLTSEEYDAWLKIAEEELL